MNLTRLLSLSFISCCATTALAAPLPIVARDTYGELGLIEMPSARMAADGTISLTGSALRGSQRMSLGFQALPWLEGTFRYSRVLNYPGAGGALFDRSLGFKVRLSRETDLFPEISIGTRDILGTGVYGAEYVALSKRIGDLDLTGGVGWGRLGGSADLPNPFAQISSGFALRGERTPTGGTVNFNQFFRGEKIGVFAGAAWLTPIPDLKLLVELSSDRYPTESSIGFRVRSPVNVGLKYEVANTVELSASWLYGSSYGLVASFSMDPAVSEPGHIGPEVLPPHYRTDEERSAALATLQGRPPNTKTVRAGIEEGFALSEALSQVGAFREYEIHNTTLIVSTSDFKRSASRCPQYAAAASIYPTLTAVAVSDLDDGAGAVKVCKIGQRAATVAGPSPNRQPLDSKLATAFRQQDLELLSAHATDSTITIVYQNFRYSSQAEAIGRLARILMENTPPSVEVFKLILMEGNFAVAQTNINRSALERALLLHSTPSEIGPSLEITSAPTPDKLPQSPSASRFSWAIGPTFRLLFFDPRQPLQGEIYLYAGAAYQLTKQLSLRGTAEANVLNNFEPGFPSNSVLPHVRTDIAEYFNKGLNGVQNLYASYSSQLAKDTYMELRAGYLEDMFGGVGGQILWRPGNGRWAYGADVYQVWQREYDRLFGFRDYQVLTGHASVYYQSPWAGLNFAVHAGRYLAKDYGATFEIRRRFASGVEIGAFATLTNVPFAKFGEGSFDKGIYIYIPFEWALPIFTRSGYPLQLRSITRDGGARLYGDDSLYWTMSDTTAPEIEGNAEQILSPPQ